MTVTQNQSSTTRIAGVGVVARPGTGRYRTSQCDNAGCKCNRPKQ